MASRNFIFMVMLICGQIAYANVISWDPSSGRLVTDNQGCYPSQQQTQSENGEMIGSDRDYSLLPEDSDS